MSWLHVAPDEVIVRSAGRGHRRGWASRVSVQG